MATPLAPAKVVPLAPLGSTSTTKRPPPGSIDLAQVRKKSKTGPSTPTTEFAQFKVPAIPHRALTPSTSTVAASSSPSRGFAMSSSPSRQVEGKKISSRVVLESGRSLIFGRHRHNLSHSSSSTSSVFLKSAVPVHLHHLVTDLDSPTSIVYLSSEAKTASRTHALVDYDAASDEMRVLVIGQNGMKINGKRILAGQRIEMDRRAAKARGYVVFDFYGVVLGVEFPVETAAPQPPSSPVPVSTEPREQADLSQLFPSSPARPMSPSLSLPPSSPPMEPLTPVPDDVDMDGDAVDETRAGKRASSPIFSDRSSSPLSDAESEEEEGAEEEEEADADLPSEREDEAPAESESTRDSSREKSVKRELVDQVARPTLSTHESVEQDPIPSHIDLPALLATTVVFSGSTKLSLPDLVKHMLDSQSNLRDLGSDGRWEKWAHEVLEHNPMFGKVERHGKDSSGHPLLPHYFYNPGNDPDTARAEQLGGLVRPLRTVQRAGGKAIDWRPVGSGRRRY